MLGGETSLVGKIEAVIRAMKLRPHVVWQEEACKWIVDLLDDGIDLTHSGSLFCVLI